MEEGDKSIGFGGETSSRVSAGSPSWLFARRQRFTIDLRPGETTIVSWKRLVKDAQNTSLPLTAQKTEDSLDECFQDDKSTIKQNGLLVNSEKLECINEPVLSVAQQSRKRSKNMAEAQGEKVDDHLPSKHMKVEQGRLNFAATNALLEEQSSALLQNSAVINERDQKLHNLLSSPVRSSFKKPATIGTKCEHSSYTAISNNDASISPLNSKDADKYRSATIHSSDIGNNANSLATHQKYLEKNSCKQLESPVRKLMTDNDKEGISTKIEQREKRATCGELPDLNLPVYPAQPERNLREMVLLGLSAKREKADRFQKIKMEVTEMIKLQASKRRDVATDDLQEVLGSEEQLVLKEQYIIDSAMEDKICDLYDLYVQGMDEDKGPQIRKLYVELAELWPNGIMDNHGIKSAIRRAKERRRALCKYDKVREDSRKKSAQKMEVGVQGEASSISQLRAVQERQTSESSSHILALPCRKISCKETPDQHLDASKEISRMPLKGSGLDISEEERIEKMVIPMLKEQMKKQQQQRRELKKRVKKLSLKLEKESRKSHRRAIGQPHAANYELAAPPGCGNPV